MSEVERQFDAAERVEDLSDISVLNWPKYLRQRYRQIAFVTHERHVADYLADTETLLVTTDWLLWRQLCDRGVHCLHLEGALEKGPCDDEREDTLFLRYNDWSRVAGHDVTEFMGVSLGTLFWREVTLACLAYDRLRAGMTRLCAHFSPATLVFHDLRADYDILDHDIRRDLAAQIAHDHAIAFVDRADPLPLGDPAFSDNLVFGQRPALGRRQKLIRLFYGLVANAVFWLRWKMTGAHPLIYMINNPMMVRSLFNRGLDRASRLALLAEQWPKSPRFLRSCWDFGVRIVAMPNVALDRTERVQIESMVAQLAGHWRDAPTGFDKARWQFIRRRLLDTGWLLDRAIRVKRYHALFARLKPGRVVVGDVTNGECRTSVEVARLRGIPCDELPNGMFFSVQRNSARLDEDGRAGAIGRILAWGNPSLRWAKIVAPTLTCRKTGYAPVDLLQRSKVAAMPNKGRWLILPCHVDGDDIRGLKANTLSYLIDTIRTLQAMGHSPSQIRVKLHPSMPLRMDYVQRMLNHFGLDIAVHRDTPLAEHLAWTDFVVGPVTSGAFMETPALGRPYYAMRPWPSSVDRSSLADLPIFASAAAVGRAVAAGYIPDPDETLDALCAIREIPDPADCVWRALEVETGAACAV